MFEGIIAALKSSVGASAVGAVISIFFVEAHLGKIVRVMMAAAGFAISVYLTPWVMDYFRLAIKFEPGVGFLTGLFGMSILSRIASVIKQIDLIHLLERWFGKKGG